MTISRTSVFRAELQCEQVVDLKYVFFAHFATVKFGVHEIFPFIRCAKSDKRKKRYSSIMSLPKNNKLS